MRIATKMLAMVVALSFVLGTAAFGADVKIRVGIGAAADSGLGIGVLYMAEKVKEYSNGEMEVELFSDSLLGGDRDMIEGVAFGTIEMCNVATGPVGNFSDRFFVLDMPYLVTDTAVAHKVLDGPLGREILDSLLPSGIKALNFWELGFRHLYNSKKMIVHPEDVKGMKLRVMENDVHIGLWSGLGAFATPMSIGEVFTALQQGTIDGHDNPIGPTYAGKYFEADRNCSLTSHIYSATVSMINHDFFESLSPEHQEILLRADAEARDYERTVVARQDKEDIENWKNAGGTITKVDLKEWQDASAFMLDQFTDRIDMRVVEALRGN